MGGLTGCVGEVMVDWLTGCVGEGVVSWWVDRAYWGGCGWWVGCIRVVVTGGLG